MTERCVSDIGIPNDEPFNIYIRRMLLKSILIYTYELRGIYLGLPEAKRMLFVKSILYLFTHMS